MTRRQRDRERRKKKREKARQVIILGRVRRIRSRHVNFGTTLKKKIVSLLGEASDNIEMHAKDLICLTCGKQMTSLGIRPLP